MSRCSVVNFLHSFFFNNSKRAFTLAEALIITVMTGACLLPILGTMQNAQVRTENFDHQSKMQQYARSRLTQEIANAAFDHKSINLDDEYHYIVYFASSTSNENATEDEAKLIELPKSYATLEDLASLTIDPERSHWATSAVDLLGISRDKGAPYLKVVHAYKTSVETQYDIKLATYTPGVDSEGGDSSFPSPKGLLAIVVKTCLLESNGQMYHEDDGCLVIDPPIANADGSTTDRDVNERVSPVTLFSFANLPIVSDEYIWIADSHNKKVVGIDPESRTLATEIDFKNEGESGKPLHIAVHPSGKILAVQAKKKVFLVNIDIKSPFKGERKLVVSNTHDYATEEEGGIAFRTDGKVLYFTDKENNKLHIYELEYSFNSDNTIKWTQNTPSTLTSNHAYILFSKKEFSNIVAANDGNLYIGENDSNIIHQYPMYSVFTNGNPYETVKLINTDKKIRSIDVSNDGKYLLYTPKEHTSNKSLARIYDTKTGKIVKTIEAAKELSYGIFSTISNKDSSVTDSSLFVVLTEKKKDGNNGAGVQVFGLDDKTCELQNTNIEENGRIIQSPYDSKVIFISKMKKGEGQGKDKEKDRTNLYFSDFLYSTAAHNLTDEEAMGLNEEKGVSALHADLAANKRDIMAVAKENKHIDLYDLNTLKELENTGFVATYSLADLTMSNQGTMLYSSHSDNAQGCYKYNLSDCSTVNPSVNTYRKKSVFDGNPQDMLFALQYTKDNSGNITNEGFVNIYYSTFDRWETIATDSYDRRDFSIDPEWKGLDLIGMPKGGAMVLYGKSDGSSMLEWIGRRNWAQDSDDKKGKYRLFSRWTNIKGSTNGASKTLPNYSLDSCKDECDSWMGRIAIMKNFELPINGKVISLNAIAANWSGAESSRSIMPLLLELQSDGVKFKIKDVGIPVDFSKEEVKVGHIINWKNGGLVLNSNYRLGFYSGRYAPGHGSDGPKAGAIWYVADSNYSYIADYYKDTINYPAYGDATGGAAASGEIWNMSPTFTEYPNAISEGKGRNYALSFNIAIPGNEFPPLGAKKIAITPNQSMLAILATNTSDVPIVNLYDFNNQIYDQETQIEGLLVDYREQKDSGVRSGSITRPWPEETGESLFGKVENVGHLKNDEINVFPNLTTKNDSWLSFNRQPANYYVDSDNISKLSSSNQKKVHSNKRFWGYFRPEKKIKSMQFKATEDFRFFYNYIYLGGLLGNSGSFFNSPNIECNAFSSSFLQIDQTSDGEGMYLGTFIGDEGFTTNISEDSHLQRNNGSDYLNSYFSPIISNWDFLKSEQTYILNNRPSFMASFKANIDSSTSLNITNTSMLFSRDRAKPVLYLTGSTYLWALYRNSLIRVKQDDDSSIKTNLAISTGGQKLLYGKTGGTSGVIRVVDISSPDDSKFRNTVLTTKEENVSGFSNSYLSKITDLSLDSAPSNLATKPFNSYSSEKTGGNYELMATEDFSISSNAVAVASGGIYIVNNASSTIGVYNPVTSYNTVEIKNDVLKKNANSVAVTAYDDTIYLFGNAGNGTDDAISGRVQSFNINTKKALKSLNKATAEPLSNYPDSYQVNFGIPNIGNDSFPSNFGFTSHNGNNVGNYIIGSSVENAYHAFVQNTEDYSVARSSSSFIELNYDCPLIINSIKFRGKGEIGIGSLDPVTSARLSAFKADGSEVSLWNNGSIDDGLNEYQLLNSNSIAYSKYKVFFIKSGETLAFASNISSSHPGGIGFIQLWRKNVKRITPSVGDSAIGTKYSSNSYYNQIVNPFSWNGTEIKCSACETSCDLKDVYVPGKTDSNTSENNVFTSNAQGWDTKVSFPCIIVNLSNKEAVSAVRYASSNRSNSNEVRKTLKMFKLFGTNVEGDYNPSDYDTNDSAPDPSIWKPILFTNDSYSFVGPDVNNTFVTAEVKAPQKYKYYLIKVYEFYGTTTNAMRMIGFEMFSSPEKDELPSEDYLTPLRDDDLSEVKAGLSAACATPYGLVTTGGLKGTTATTTALLYWPHAVNKYDGQYTQYGISRSLPGLNCARSNHALIWHKGKIYAIGGMKDNSVISDENFVECLDYNNNMQWNSIPVNSSISAPIHRYNFGACSFGDEIFVFGGQNGEGTSKNLSSAYAWNPETGNVRKLTDLHEPLSPCSAVAFGSKIYVIGMGSGSSSGSGSLKIYEYTP